MTTHQPIGPRPADPNVPDDFAALAAQPIGYWSGVAHDAVIRHIRDGMAGVDITQPQWWILNQVAGAGPAGRTRDELVARLAGTIGVAPEEIARAADSLLARGWLTADEQGALRLTDAGRAAKARAKELVDRMRAEIHEGVTDEEYVGALRVLRRMIDNVAAARGAA
ncbi:MULTISPECIES: MarR family winged helix-turn-helix transcriptional regulator [Streptomyces]|uniref:MarR family winged helix-turn-helix transcriptional regulator n=1 Tax=Streptomyces TaxID=1883 RepID=UPI00163CEAB2|nr:MULTISPECIES: MarR family winged helix-turn-helix transcriptional regulator [Streptomyces]MBC2877869.1 winged helix-turn-helix transcriptional regulator [Streptomyces sp. TYQ1024]UBI38005.1 MarR family winged helix-turn-helix transcriptional regulator [Streptomyces mobaraensis]UKW30592.1 MarR family winged helix-turn-helix transcriptional regulator [Streptomyces sp. TYQ1024]